MTIGHPLCRLYVIVQKSSINVALILQTSVGNLVLTHFLFKATHETKRKAKKARMRRAKSGKQKSEKRKRKKENRRMKSYLLRKLLLVLHNSHTQYLILILSFLFDKTTLYTMALFLTKIKNTKIINIIYII